MFFSFTVMESDPVAHMIGVIAVEPLGAPLWFDITGKDVLRVFFYVKYILVDVVFLRLPYQHTSYPIRKAKKVEFL